MNLPQVDNWPETLNLDDLNVRLRQLTGGERLDLIAAEEYGNPAWWRLIAEFNQISDPLRLPAGMLLRLPRRSLLEERA